jgi:hypothetical protein
MYVYSNAGAFIGVIPSLGASGVENVSKLNLPSNAKIRIGFRIWGGGGSLSNAPFIGSTRIAVTY